MTLFIWAPCPEAQGNESFPKMNNCDDSQAPHCPLKQFKYFIAINKYTFLCTSMFHLFSASKELHKEFLPIASPRVKKKFSKCCF